MYNSSYTNCNWGGETVFDTIIEMVAFYVCYFSKMLAQKKKGIQTDQMGKGKEGFVKFVELTLKIVTCLTPIVELISIWSFYFCNDNVPSANCKC